MKILCIDDDLVTQMLLKPALSRFGDVDTADSGEAGLQLVKKALLKGCPYDLITVDYTMPEISGTVVVNLIRSFEDLRDIPADKRCKVVMITGSDDRKVISHAFRVACDDYIIKPISMEKFTGCFRGLGLLKT
ncbi:MAG: hypothetical protein RL095_1304 [Verrucomicrobiota bacterium]|jgi:CheY-like chemotaxis protein